MAKKEKYFRMIRSGMGLGGAIRMRGEVIPESYLHHDAPRTIKEQQKTYKNGRVWYVPEEDVTPALLAELKNPDKLLPKIDIFGDSMLIQPSWGLTEEEEEHNAEIIDAQEQQSVVVIETEYQGVANIVRTESPIVNDNDDDDDDEDDEDLSTETVAPKVKPKSKAKASGSKKKKRTK